MLTHGSFRILNSRSFTVIHCAQQNPLVFKERTPEVNGNVKLMSIEGNSYLNLSTVGENVNTGKIYHTLLFTWVMRETGPFLQFPCSLQLHSIIPHALFYFFRNVNFLITMFGLLIPNPLEINFCSVFIQWGSLIKFFFLEPQDIVDYRDFISKISGSGHKMLVLRASACSHHQPMFW